MTTSATKTREELIEEGQALVHSLAAKTFRNIPLRVELNDLIAYGELGLAEAARDYNPEQGSQFTTFAYYRIRGAIYDGLSKMSWTSRARYHRMRYEHMANEVLKDEAYGSHDRDSLEGGANWFRDVTGKLAVVHLVTSDEGGGGIRDSTIVDPRAQAPAIVASREVSQRLRELVDGLPAAERRLITTVYFEGATLQEAADRLGISKSWASRLHARILEKLARSLRAIGASD